MSHSPPVLIVIFVVALCHASAIYLFTSGFFLTRYSVDQVSECDISSVEILSELEIRLLRDKFGREHKESSCWAPKKFSKAVIVVIDALRYDFVLFNASERAMGYHRNKLPVFRDVLRDEPHNAFIYKFMADPPTTTLQRIKGLTTGGLPTFIDAADNFDPSQSIKEDNLIDQLLRKGSKIMFMGDDTWTSVYPNKFTETHAYPSLVVKDLHTVDNGVTQHIFPYLKGERGLWNVVIGHFLGVDHVGHTFGSDHPAMAPKLEQMNQVIKSVISHLDNETLLVVMGDHGMTWDGNHGGASEEELSSMIFFYARRPLNRFRASSRETLVENDLLTISQVDFTSTMSFLLGTPIPFGNLGQLIPELLSGLDRRSLSGFDSFSTDEKALVLSGLSNLTLYRFINAAQMMMYLVHYSNKTRQFPLEFIVELQSRYSELRRRLLSPTLWTSHSELAEFQAHFDVFYSYGIEMCHRLWTSFDELRMVKGAGILLCALAILAYHLLCDSTTSALLQSAGFGGVLGIISLLFNSGTENALLIAWSAVTFLFFRRFSVSAAAISMESVYIALVLVLRAAALGGNSYVEAEDKVLRYALITTLVVLLFRTSRSIKSLWELGRPLAMLLSVAGLFSATGGRHENVAIPEDSVASLELLLPLLLLFLHEFRFSAFEYLVGLVVALTLSLRFLLPGLGSVLEIWLSVALAMAFLLRIIAQNPGILSHWPLKLVVLTQSCVLAVYWSASYLAVLEDLHSPRLFPFFFRIILPDFVYMIAVIYSIYRIMHSNLTTSRSYSILLELSLVFYPAFALVLGRRSLFGFSLFFSFVANASDLSPLWSQFGLAATMAFLGDYFFYKTGHKPAFSALQFQSPYVGFDHYNYFLSGFIVAANTFVGQILMTSMLIYLSWRGQRRIHASELGSRSPAPPRFSARAGAKDNQVEASTSSASAQAVLLYIGCQSIVFALSLITTGLNRRHLMVWRVFAPKYIFDAVGLLVLDAVLLFLYAVLLPFA